MSFFRNLLIEKKRKPYYCEVEYLESNSAQRRISTGITVDTLPVTVDISFSTTSVSSNPTYQVIVGTVTGNQYFIGFTSGDPTFAVKYNDNTYNTGVVPVADTVYRLKSTISTSTATLSIDGTDYTNTRAYTANNEEIGLFAQNYGTNSNRIYACKIYKGSTLVRDMIPCLDFSLTPCMYDKISGKLFYNQGSGNFTAGREIHYVEYLETTSQTSTSTTKPWINTLVNYWADFEIGVKLRESAPNVCLNCGGGSYRFERINATNPYWRFQGGGGDYNYDSTIPITEYHVLKWKDGKISCDGEVLVERDHLLNSGTYTILFTNSTTSGNTIYPNVVYFLKMWNPTDGTLVRDYLPAIDENGVGFMFDRVTHTIYDNAGTGAFKYPAREVEYIQSTGT